MNCALDIHCVWIDDGEFDFVNIILKTEYCCCYTAAGTAWYFFYQSWRTDCDPVLQQERTNIHVWYDKEKPNIHVALYVYLYFSPQRGVQSWTLCPAVLSNHLWPWHLNTAARRCTAHWTSLLGQHPACCVGLETFQVPSPFSIFWDYLELLWELNHNRVESYTAPCLSH